MVDVVTFGAADAGGQVLRTPVEQITTLYVGYFGRAPDPDGLAYWTQQVSQGMSLDVIAQAFAGSAEARALYSDLGNPGSFDAARFVADIYQNLFNRAPDAEGHAYWTNLLQNGWPVGEMIQTIISAAQSTDIASIDNKVAASLHYTSELERTGRDFDIQEARGVEDKVDHTPTSLEDALKVVDHIIAHPPGEVPPLPGPNPGPVNPGPGPVDPGPQPQPDKIVWNSQTSIDPSAVSPGGDMYYGDGNTPDNWNITQNETKGIEVALKVHSRYGADYEPVKSENNIATYHVREDTSSENRAEWSFDYSVATGLNGSGKNLSDYVFKLMVDLDPTDKVDFKVFTMVFSDEFGTPWMFDENTGLSNGSQYLGGTDKGAVLSQNSVNIGFTPWLGSIDMNPETVEIDAYDFGQGEFDIRLVAYDKTGKVELAGVHSKVLVDDAFFTVI